MNAEMQEERPRTAVELIKEASGALGWVANFEEQIIEYCRRRRPSGEVVWAKVREWGSDEWKAVEWSSLAPAERAALDLLAIYFVGIVDVAARHFPTSTEPAVRFVAAERKAEDTIFERHERSGAIDPHRLAAAQAVARIMEQSGVTIGDVETVLTIEAPTEGDETGDPDETEDDADDADDETFDGDGGTAAGEPGPRPAPSETPVDGDAAPADKPPRRKAR